jgi:hypothetical protein
MTVTNSMLLYDMQYSDDDKAMTDAPQYTCDKDGALLLPSWYAIVVVEMHDL